MTGLPPLAPTEDLPPGFQVIDISSHGDIRYRCICGQEQLCSSQDWPERRKYCVCSGTVKTLPRRNLIGHVFQRWTVIGWVGKLNNSLHHSWHCRCECGTSKAVLQSSLLGGLSKSCGCLIIDVAHERAGKNAIDLVGQRFGQLMVLHRMPIKGKSREARWMCQCDCGKTHEASASSLKFGKVSSCGCLRSSGPTAVEMIGQRYGTLVVIELAPLSDLDRQKGMHGARLRCRCDCGKEVKRLAAELRAGQKIRCFHPDHTSLVGQRFGHLEVISQAENTSGQEARFWLCRCDCGRTTTTTTNTLRGGRAKTCGCRMNRRVHHQHEMPSNTV